ncbi:glycosyltransferase [Flagellimonas sp.]|uniref:glycosyltransferase n=1 Tax=Flagellimonas sp. TaxID=2058762 RepID=UPI003BA9C13D
MRLSIVIPLYNKEKYIDRCLQSLLNQDLPPNEYEIIIVDDDSTDSSYSIAKDYAKDHFNIHAVHQQNGGAGSARNKGLDLAKGNYIYFLDADDYIASNTLKHLLNISESNNLEITGFKSVYANNTDHLSDSYTKNPQELAVQVFDGISFIVKHGYRNEAWWYIIKKSFLIDTGIRFTEGRFIQDSIFTATLLLRPKRITKVDFDVHRFVKVENSATTNKKPTHILKFIDDLIYAIEQFDLLIKGMDNSEENYHKIVKAYKRKQQSFVFTIFIKVFKGGVVLNYKDLKNILIKLKLLNVYPINPKLGGIGNSKTRLLYNLTYVPVFNNRILLFLGLKLNRLISSR